MSLPFLPYPAPGADPECFVAAARYVQREYGDTGYRMTLEGAGGPYGAFRVAHFDGSEFRVMADRYGNAWTLPDVEDLGEAVRLGHIAEEARRAEAFARIDAAR